MLSMSASNERKIIKQYQPLIRALIPYEQHNKLLEGLNKFAGRVPSPVRKIIRDEVIRLTSLTDAPVDNSAFAQFPVFKFSHFGVQMCLDKVGTRILHKESALYQQRYTVGVFETLTSSDFYQEHIKKENYKKVVDAFTVETQSLQDIHFGEDIAITPNFPVSSPEFERGRNCSVSSLGYKTMTLESKRPAKVGAGDEFNFHFPDVPGLPKGLTINYVASAMKFNQQTEKYETHFKMAASVGPKMTQIIEKYINLASFQQPLQRQLESERTMQDLERDRILDNSPWVPVFINRTPKGLRPQMALFTKNNETLSGGRQGLNIATRKRLFPRLMTEIHRYKEVYIISGTMSSKQGDYYLTATLRELESSDLLAPVIHIMNKNGSLRCLQCRLAGVEAEDKEKAFSIHDLTLLDYPDLADIDKVIFYKEVSSSLADLVITEKRAIPAVAEDFVDDLNSFAMDIVREEGLDNRVESRFLLDRPGAVKTGLLTAAPVTIKDISVRGLRLVFEQQPKKVDKEIKVTIPELKVKNQKYEVVDYNPNTREMRLKLPTKRDTIASGIGQFVQKNAAYFKNRDLALLQRNTHRFLWELAMRHHPSASILCTTNRYLLNRLKTVYQTSDCDDLYPFSQVDNVAPMHGFFADREAQKPKSELLSAIFSGAVTHTSVFHCVRNSDSKLVFLPEPSFRFGALRNNVKQQLHEHKVTLCVTRIEVSRCASALTPLTKKRLAQLSRIDKPMYDRFNVMQSSYTHVLFLTSESVLHNSIMNASLRPYKQVEKTARRAEA
ncbi:PilZ domain-containing protein [Alteromonas sp. C1M14]|uniref:PilZ domain-containing protein n=1 Tax=Alteromonas sp. C1M14 TaxID=2841567 RepID=UPI001C08F123|nr:PilZ domain-containing protein [Alteromonas sp. C1M14]MBU2976814.1 PilZ domain-containing protein [Alteromonas sp. C1M14]